MILYADVGFAYLMMKTMKQLLILFAIGLSLKTFSQKEGDAIIGKWINIPKQNTIIEVSKFNSEYKGKIVWTKTPNKKKPVGFMILEELKYNGKRKIWEKGKVRVPNSAIVYDAIARIKEDGTLEVNGYLGFKFLGKKKNFRKVK
jgi:uncharacterized protein (DUF2147 family)